MGLLANGRAKGHEHCSGCSLCLLACPVWRVTRDIRLSPHGRAKALQHGATAEELAASLDACTFCGACEPACPEDIALLDMVAGLRAQRPPLLPEPPRSVPRTAAAAATLMVPDRALSADADLLAATLGRLGAAAAGDDGADIAWALEAGRPVLELRRREFAAALERAGRVVVADGLLVRALRRWLPGMLVQTLGEAISALVRDKLGAGDLYVIESRAYHADRERLVRHYDDLRAESGCAMNLDLQRLAVPTTAGSHATASGRGPVDAAGEARWIIEGRTFSRIVVETTADIAAFRQVTDKPVVHVAQL